MESLEEHPHYGILQKCQYYSTLVALPAYERRAFKKAQKSSQVHGVINQVIKYLIHINYVINYSLIV